MVRPNCLILKSMDGKDLSKTSQFAKSKVIESGSSITIGGNEVEVSNRKF